MTIRSWMSLTMDLIGSNKLELLALELEFALCLHSSIYNNQPIST